MRWLKGTPSRWFILKPIVKETADALKEHNLINSYLRDKYREDLYGEDLLFVLFKPPDFDYFELFLHQQIAENKNYVEDYDYEGGYVVVVYKIPDGLKADFELFKRGKYSRMSDRIKASYGKEIRRTGTVKQMVFKKTFQHMVFTKDPQLQQLLEEYMGIRFADHFPSKVDMELWEAVDMEKETLDIDKIKENEQQTVATTKGTT